METKTKPTPIEPVNKLTRHLEQICEARKEIHNTEFKTDSRGYQGNLFLSLEAITCKVEPILLKHNLLSIVSEKKTGEKSYEIEMKIISTETYQYVSAKTSAQVDDVDAQSVRSLHTYATRSLYRQLLALPIDKDDDGVDANYKTIEARQKENLNKNAVKDFKPTTEGDMI